MAYHEYTDSSGHLRRQHDNGRRPRQAVLQFGGLDQVFEQAHPDSKLWESAAWQAMQQLGNLLGRERYRDWAELTWPGAEIDRYTWRQICEMTDEAFGSALVKGERDLAKLAETARSVHDPSIAQVAVEI